MLLQKRARGDQLQLVRSMLSEIAERSDTCHTMTDVTTIGDLRCECACGVQLVPETSAALFIKRTDPLAILRDTYWEHDPVSVLWRTLGPKRVQYV